MIHPKQMSYLVQQTLACGAWQANLFRAGGYGKLYSTHLETPRKFIHRSRVQHLFSLHASMKVPADRQTSSERCQPTSSA